MTDINLSELYDDSKSLNQGPFKIPNYTPEGWLVRTYIASGFLDPDKPIRGLHRAGAAGLPLPRAD